MYFLLGFIRYIISEGDIKQIFTLICQSNSCTYIINLMITLNQICRCIVSLLFCLFTHNNLNRLQFLCNNLFVSLLIYLTPYVVLIYNKVVAINILYL